MRSRTFIIVAIALVALALGSVAVYAADQSRSDTIAGGVRAGNVDVGGLTRAQARAKLRSALLDPLDKPVVVEHGSHEFTLTPRQAKVAVNVNALVDQAVERSREGGIVTRTIRAITGDEVHATIDPQITYNRAAVRRLATRVKAKLSRPAVDASLAFAGAGFTKVDSHDGRTVNAGRLGREIRSLVTNPAAERTVKVDVRRVKPKVTTSNLAERYPTLIVVNRSGFQLELFKNLELKKTYPIAVGQVGLETPAGLYHVQNKAENPAWSVPNSDWAGDLAGTVVPGGSPENPLKARWLGIFDGAGIHGTDSVGSLGTAASHGCIRMAVPDVIELYDQVPVQTPVYIA